MTKYFPVVPKTDSNKPPSGSNKRTNTNRRLLGNETQSPPSSPIEISSDDEKITKIKNELKLNKSKGEL